MSRFGACIIDATGPRLTAEEKQFFSSANPFGFILFARNIETPDQVRALCAEMRESVGRNAPILIDQEGGKVQRMRPPAWREWLPPAEEIDRAAEHAEDVMYLRSRIMADELLSVGVDTNCAPLIDVICSDTHEFLLDRCYGSDPDKVARIGRAVADGLLAGGVLPVIKHMPGHGRAAVDSHFSLPQTTAPIEDLAKTDFAPFAALADLPMGMTGHVVFSDLDSRPATTSPVIMKLIRDEIGFDGLVMTDDISMKALDGGLRDITQSSLAAGCDVVLFCNGAIDARREVAEVAGQLSDVGQARAERALSFRRAPDKVDIALLEEKLVALTERR